MFDRLERLVRSIIEKLECTSVVGRVSSGWEGRRGVQVVCYGVNTMVNTSSVMLVL